MVGGECKECRSNYKGADCLSTRGSSLETLKLKRGFWRTGPKSHRILECAIEGACLGGNVSGSYCAEGYQSYYCQVCSTNYFKSGDRCELCSEGTTTLVLAISAFVIVSIFTFLCWYFAETIETKIHYILTPRVRSRLKILVSFSQIMYALPAVFEMAFPAIFEDFLVKIMSILSLSFLGWPQGFSCVYWTTFYSQFIMGCGVPMMIWFFVLVYYIYAVVHERQKRTQATEMGASETQTKILWDAAKYFFGDSPSPASPSSQTLITTISNHRRRHRHHLSRAERHLAETRCMTFFLLTSYIILPSVSYTIFSMFSCEEFDDGAYLLRIDYQIRCQGVWYRSYFVLAILAALAFPIGVPLCYWFLLWRKRERLNPENMAEEDIFKYRLKTRKLDAIRFLFDMYHARVWWWEVFETGRRLCLTGALMVFEEGSVLQLFVGITICLVALMMYAHYVPFIEDEDNTIATFAQLEIYFVLVMGMLMQSNANGGEGEKVVGILMVSTTVMLFATAIGIEFKGAQAGCKSMREALTEGKDEKLDTPVAHMRASVIQKEMEASGINLLDREMIGHRRAGVGMGHRLSASPRSAGFGSFDTPRTGDGMLNRGASFGSVSETIEEMGSSSESESDGEDSGATWECKTNHGWEPFGSDIKGRSIGAKLEHAYKDEGVVAWAAYHKEGHVIRKTVTAHYVINWARYEQINTTTMTCRPFRRCNTNGVVTHPPDDHKWAVNETDLGAAAAEGGLAEAVHPDVAAPTPKPKASRLSKEERAAKEAAFLESLRQKREASTPPSKPAAVSPQGKPGFMSLWSDLFGDNERESSIRDPVGTMSPAPRTSGSTGSSEKPMKKSGSLEDLMKQEAVLKKFELAGNQLKEREFSGSGSNKNAAFNSDTKGDVTPRRDTQLRNPGWTNVAVNSTAQEASTRSAIGKGPSKSLPPIPSSGASTKSSSRQISFKDYEGEGAGENPSGESSTLLGPSGLDSALSSTRGTSSPRDLSVKRSPSATVGMEIGKGSGKVAPPSATKSARTVSTATVVLEPETLEAAERQTPARPRGAGRVLSSPGPPYSDSESEPEEGTNIASGTSWVLAPGTEEAPDRASASDTDGALTVMNTQPAAATYQL
mmetsp:Transcript_86887/g.246181  ORF Transcript_86887/g.246181 Transcript_86887/m.246181 type:complete len:1116 (-) Transcript_86887:190-3537(-)